MEKPTFLLPSASITVFPTFSNMSTNFCSMYRGFSPKSWKNLSINICIFVYWYISNISRLMHYIRISVYQYIRVLVFWHFGILT